MGVNPISTPSHIMGLPLGRGMLHLGVVADLTLHSLPRERAIDRIRHSMLPHLAYYGALSDLETQEGSAEWSATAAGLIALRLVDRWIAHSGRSPQVSSSVAPILDPDDLAPDVLTELVAAARVAVAGVEESNPYRAALERLVDACLSGAPTELFRALFAYAHALHLHARWPLAADVYETIWRMATAPGSGPPRALEALRPVALERLGHSRRMLGDIEGAAEAYSEARAAARAANDVVRESRVRISEANLLIHLGNLPASARLLDDIINAATRLVEDPLAPERSALAELSIDDIPLADIHVSPRDVLALARHDRGVVASMQGDPAAAIEHSFFAWRSYRDPIRRERAWCDLARALADLGLRDAARDAFLVLHMTARERELQWIAALNLLEMAALDGQLEAFGSYRAVLEEAAAQGALPAWLWAWAVFYTGVGEARFGRPDRARAALELARQLAKRDQVNEIYIRADAALSALDRGRSLDPPLAPRVPVAPTIQRIARLVRRARIRVAEARSTSHQMRGLQGSTRVDALRATIGAEKPTELEFCPTR